MYSIKIGTVCYRVYSDVIVLRVASKWIKVCVYILTLRKGYVVRVVT